MAKARYVQLAEELARQRPDLSASDAADAVLGGRVLVDGRIVQKLESRVRRGCALVVAEARRLRGEAKLGHVLDRFRVPVAGRAALDVGAAAGGFTRALLDRGAARVYAVDAGHGQLVGSLRQDPRVVNLEATNVAGLTETNVGEPIGLVAVDVSYLSLRDALGALGSVRFTTDAWLVGLVKPMFELARPSLPTAESDYTDACRLAAGGAAAAGWEVVATPRSEVLGAAGAVEFFVIGRRAPTADRPTP